MNIKKFEEYKIVDEHDDIGDEYAKIILSRFIDTELDGKTIQNIYNDIIIEEELDDSQEEMILYAIYEYSKEIAKEAKELKTLIASNASKYNL